MNTISKFESENFQRIPLAFHSKIVFPLVLVVLGSGILKAQEIPSDTTGKEQLIEQVVLIGYGNVKKGDETGAVTAIKADQTTKGFAPNAQDMLVGKVAGVHIVSEGGSPSGGSVIRIRGGSSLSASNDPLIIVDGVSIDNQGLGGAGNILNAINPTDIESFTILKDASATAIYGSRASNGVILITTKKGRSGGLRVTFDGNMSVSTPKDGIAVLDAEEFRSFINSRYANQGNFEEILSKLGTSNTDWQKQIFRTTFNSESNLSLLGSIADKVPFRASLGYTTLSGTLKTSEMERYTGSISLSPSLFEDHLKINVNARGMSIKNRFANQGAIGAAIYMDPTQSVMDPTSPFGGYYSWRGNDGNLIQVATINPVSLLTMASDEARVDNFIGNAQFDYKVHFLPELKLNLNLGLDYSKSDGSKLIPALAPSDYLYGGLNSSWDQQRRNSSVDFYAQYIKDLGFLNSRFDLMGGYSWQHYYREGSNIGHRVSRFDEFGDPLLISTNDYASENYIVSFFGRLNYTINDKYLFTFTLRNDGSSRFAKENRWALFPSAAFAWKLSDDLFKDSSVVRDLKLRLGYGVTGQQDINQGDYPYLGTYEHSVGNEASYLQGYNNGEPIWVSLLRPSAYNPNLKWESTETYNIGLDYSFFNSRLEGAIDLYQRKTKDLINAETKVAAGTNFREFVAANIGTLENRGAEFSLNSKPIQTENFSWDLGGNIAYNENTITSLSYGDDKQTMRRYSVNVHKVGYAAGMFYLYEQIYDTNGKPIEGFYKDQNNDGLINENDLITYHNATPDYTFGINTKFRYKAFDLSMASHGSLGNYNYNSIAAGAGALSSSSVYANEFIVNRAESSLYTQFETSHNTSNYYVENASFWRIDNITLGWNFKGQSGAHRGGRVYAVVQNPLIVTDYSGLDPEVFGGYDGNIYPRPVTFLLGTSINF
ncbi:SusC/RagA family TonB-linked outer membrane protein [Chryseobacterium sp. A301]